MNKLRSYLKTRNFGYPAIVTVAALFLFAGMLVASSIGTTPHVTAAAPRGKQRKGLSPVFR